jgi:hypothetical protein
VSWNREKQLRGAESWGRLQEGQLLLALPLLSHADCILEIQTASTSNFTHFPVKIPSSRHSQLWRYQYLGNPGTPAHETCTFANYMFGSDLAYVAHSMFTTEPGNTEAGHSGLLRAQFG